MTLAKRLRDQAGEQRYFLFLDAPGVEPTNNRTEKAIRQLVIDRGVAQGTPSHATMRFCERAWTVVATCARPGRSVYRAFLDALQATYIGSSYPHLVPQKA